MGSYTKREALDKLLAGTGIGYTFTADDAVAVKAIAQDTGPTAENGTAKPKKSDLESTVLPEMTVTASPTDERGYNRLDATTATKTDTPIFDTPVSIQVVPREVMDDQQAIRLEDVTRNVSGVQPAFGFGDVTEEFIIRGFRTDFRNQVFRDGFRIRGIGVSETANLERVEVLKGLAAVLFGRVEPGGIINQVSKRPLPEPYYSLQQQFGSFDLYRTTVDATGPITKDRSLSYRLNLSYINSNSFRDNVFLDRVFVSPSLAWRPREGTEVNLKLEYKNQDTIDDEGIPAIGNRPAPLPISRNFCGPECKDNVGIGSIYFNWSHRLRVCEKTYCALDLAFRRCSESSCISIYTAVPALRRNATSLRSR
ncbi:MAG: TonB-dependent siderophore receptor, partial [Gammaproteobacteria bacterium]